MNSNIIPIIILPFILSFIGAMIVYKKLQGLGKTGAVIWTVLAFGVSFFIMVIIYLVFFSNIQC